MLGPAGLSFLLPASQSLTRSSRRSRVSGLTVVILGSTKTNSVQDQSGLRPPGEKKQCLRSSINSENAIGDPRVDGCDQGRASTVKGHFTPSLSRLPILIADNNARPDAIDSSTFRGPKAEEEGRACVQRCQTEAKGRERAGRSRMFVFYSSFV